MCWPIWWKTVYWKRDTIIKLTVKLHNRPCKIISAYVLSLILSLYFSWYLFGKLISMSRYYSCGVISFLMTSSFSQVVILQREIRCWSEAFTYHLSPQAIWGLVCNAWGPLTPQTHGLNNHSTKTVHELPTIIWPPISCTKEVPDVHINTTTCVSSEWNGIDYSVTQHRPCIAGLNEEGEERQKCESIISFKLAITYPSGLLHSDTTLKKP